MESRESNLTITRPNSLQITQNLIAMIGAFVLIAIFTITFCFSPLNGEDYALTGQLDGLTTIERTLWILHRSAMQINNWNARLGEQLSIFWLSVPEIYFTLANCTTFLLFSCLLALFGVEEKSWSGQRISIAVFLVISISYIFWPRMELFFWRTTAAGYLQPLVLTLALAVVFHSEKIQNHIFHHRGLQLLLLPLGFLSGFSFENVPPSIIPYFIIHIIIQFRKHKKPPLFLISISLSYFAGWIALMLMPSTKYRTNWYKTHLETPPISFDYLAVQAARVIEAFFDSTHILAGAFLALLAFCFLRYKVNPTKNNDILLFGIPAILCSGALIISPYIEPRAFSLAWALILIFIIRLLDRYVANYSPRLFTGVLITLFISSTAMAGTVLRTYINFFEEVNSRSENITALTQTPLCNTGIKITPIRIKSDIRIINIREDWVEYNPQQISNYFKCKIIINNNK